ncbi:Hpt domain-containing protein [Deltaproteobacteria bacterium TL4]
MEMDADLREMIEGFVEDSREAFDSMEDDLIAMEESPDDTSIMNNLFRVMHTLKGTAGFMGLTEVSQLSHKLESVFDLVRQVKMPMTPRLLDFLLPAIDELKALVFALVGENESPSVAQTIATLEQIIASASDSVLSGGGAATAEKKASPEPPKEETPATTTPVAVVIGKRDGIDFDQMMKDYTNKVPLPSLEPVAPTVATKGTKSSDKYPPAPLIEESLRTQISTELLGQFVLEAEEHLETIEESLLALEETPEDINPINEFFRAIHSIKGTAGYVNLKQIEILSHRVESVFDNLRKGNLKYTKDIGDIVFRSIDILRTMVFYIKIEDYAQVIEITEAAIQLDAVIEGETPTIFPTVDKEVALEKDKKDGESDKLSVFLTGANQQLEVLKAYREEMNKGFLDEHGLITLHRSLKTLNGGASYCGLTDLHQFLSEYEELLLKLLGGELEQAEKLLNEEQKPLHDKIIATIQALQGVSSKSSTPAKQTQPSKPEPKIVAVPQPPLPPPPPPPPPPKPRPKPEPEMEVNEDEEPPVSQDQEPLPKIQDRKPRVTNKPPQTAEKNDSKATESKTMRVDASRLDRFMNLIGELIIARNAFKHLADSIDGTQKVADLTRDIKQIENNISRISDNLQDNLMEMRLVQVKTVFQRMPRIVRDIARKTNKKIQLQMLGEYTEVDKSIVEEIGDPLVHIIRNSCDHGVETPEVRLAAGKPETGTIELKASHMGSFIAIDIVDDGKGIDTEFIKKLAVKKGVISQSEADEMTEDQAVGLIFAPGFSTATQVSDISGRGVGMDVVMTNIRNIQGTVEVKSKLGEGTRVRLKLPLTLAVIEALVVGVNGHQFAIPLDAIKETVQISERMVKHLKEKSALELRGEILGVTPLTELLQLDQIKTEEELEDEEWTEETGDKKMAIVVLQSNNMEIGIAVDQLFSQQEIVVKPLEDYLASIPGLKGSTIMGDGQIVLILEPNELMDLATS